MSSQPEEPPPQSDEPDSAVREGAGSAPPDDPDDPDDDQTPDNPAVRAT